MDEHRILTGDVEGYVYAWDLGHCLDPAKGPDSLCLRAHNAMDPDVYCKDTEKNVYAVHLETAAMIQVRETPSLSCKNSPDHNFRLLVERDE